MGFDTKIMSLTTEGKTELVQATDIFNTTLFTRVGGGDIGDSTLQDYSLPYTDRNREDEKSLSHWEDIFSSFLT